ncbi:glycine receptor subunit beta-type 4-like isoform X2 [Ruditapes philippinarum]|uniref:glycine receptor subunit beta-type 4-like isoform X2 n=1 Tax=Ruditapes philippinarum TaxID=129788 RepID=UPI00295AB6CB|nr:glycine receptor subunit beta-type 4-like isoform X2 [Ruditapes philippinarum]
MIVYRKLFCRCLTIISVTCVFCVYTEPTRNELMRYLLKEAEYDHNFPPSTENATDVSVQLYITDFNSESDKDREIEFTLNLRINWTDPRLDFTRNNTTYDVIKFGDDIVDSLWMPDLYFLNERKSQLHGLFERNQLAYIYKNGSVFYSGRFNIKLHCVMSFEKYPFDTQKCPIEIQSYAYSTDYVLLHWNGENAIQIDPASDPIRPKIPSQGQSIETRNTYPITGEFSTLRTEIEIPRPDGSYNMMITVPSVILVVTALTSFLLGDNITPRIGVPTGTLISLFVQWSGTYARLSLDSTLGYLDNWMCGHLIVLGIILLANALICHCKYQKDKDRKCIRWCKRFAVPLQAESSSKSVNQLEEKNGTLQKRDNPNKQSARETYMNQEAGPSPSGVNQPVEKNVPVHTDKTINGSTIEAIKQKCHENSSSDERYNLTEQMFGKEELSKMSPEFDWVAEPSSSFVNKAYEKVPLQTLYPDYRSTSETHQDQPGPSSNGENKQMDKIVPCQTNDEPTSEADMNQKFPEAKKILNSDERYKLAKQIFGESELEQIYSEFVREKTENNFYNLLEENESLIFVQEYCCGCCKSRCSKFCAKVKQNKCCQGLAQKINIVSFFVISVLYSIFLLSYRIKWVSK